MAGKYSRNKGANAEREITNLIKDAGFYAKRISQMETNSIDKEVLILRDEYKLTAPSTGYVSFFVDEGDRVKRADLVAKIQNEESARQLIGLFFTAMETVDEVCFKVEAVTHKAHIKCWHLKRIKVFNTSPLHQLTHGTL